MRCAETQELITALVDNEVSASERAAVEGHLENCSDCAFLYRQEAVLKSEIRAAAKNLKAPAALREKIVNDARVFPGQGIFERSAWRANLLLRPAFAAALVVLLALPALYLMRSAEEPLSVSALKIHEKIVNREVPIAIAGSPEEIRATLARAVPGTFAPMAFDLSTIGLKPVGGLVEEFDGRKVLVTIYEGGGRTLTCYTLLGAEADEPLGPDIVHDPRKKMDFHTYSHGGLHAVLHRDGKVICILVSTMPLAELLAIAGFTA
jgi:anti-sigma factor (TIGR02949 family)